MDWSWLPLFANYYLIILWLSMIYIGARKNWKPMMIFGLLFMTAANVNSWLDHLPELQALLRMIINTATFAFMIYVASRYKEVIGEK